MAGELEIHYEPKQDRITIEGILYSGSYFRAMAVYGISVGETFRLSNRTDGSIMLTTIDCKCGKEK